MCKLLQIYIAGLLPVPKCSWVLERIKKPKAFITRSFVVASYSWCLIFTYCRGLSFWENIAYQNSSPEEVQDLYFFAKSKAGDENVAGTRVFGKEWGCQQHSVLMDQMRQFGFGNLKSLLRSMVMIQSFAVFYFGFERQKRTFSF